MEKCLEEGQEENQQPIEDSESEESESEVASECDSAQSEEEEKETTQDIVQEEEEKECASPTVVFDVDAVDYLTVAQSVVDSLLDSLSEQ